MKGYVSDTAFLDKRMVEIRYKKLEKLTYAKMAKTPRKPAKTSTLICEYHLNEGYIKPILILPGRHYDEVPHQNDLRSPDTSDPYYLHTVLLKGLDHTAAWIKDGITDTRGRIWFVDP